MNIRFAKEKDAADLLKIYDQYIDTTITFEYVLPTEEEFAKRICTISKIYPYLVCEECGNIVGYAYAHRLMERAAFEWDAELSIYLDERYLRNGIGKVLYETLFQLLKLQGVKTVYASVTHPNLRSEQFHQRMGFQLAGIYHHTGYKCERWCDLQLYEKQLAKYEVHPSPLIPITELPKEKIMFILEKNKENKND